MRMRYVTTFSKIVGMLHVNIHYGYTVIRNENILKYDEESGEWNHVTTQWVVVNHIYNETHKEYDPLELPRSWSVV